MVYELYVDSLFWVNFVMNLYLLILVDRTSMRTATRMRIVLGAGIGAGFYVMAFFAEASRWFKWPFFILVGTGLMLKITFQPDSFRMILKLFGRLCRYSFFIGGSLLFAGNALPIPFGWISSVSGVLGMGALLCLAISYFLEKSRERQRNTIYGAKMINGEKSIHVAALLDSGNSLREPISGKPVCVISSEVFQKLWEGSENLFRVIPYHSIGKKNGVLKGYLLPELVVEMDGERRTFQDVYMAVSEECGLEMILNPCLLESTVWGKGDGASDKGGSNKGAQIRGA